MRRLFLILCAMMLAVPAYADIVFYKDGTKSIGRIIKENKRVVIIREIDESGASCDTESPQSEIIKIVRESGEAQKKRVEKIKEARKVEGPPKPTKPPKPAPTPAPTVKPKPVEIKKAAPKVKAPVVKAAPKPKEPEVKPAVSRPIIFPVKTCPCRVDKREDSNISIDNIRMMRRKLTIIVPRGTSFEQLKAMFSCVADKERLEYGNLDAIWITAYREGGRLDGLPLAYGIWAPLNGWDDFNHIKDKSLYQWDYRRVTK
ncbi:MAG: hypothetical protein NT088_04055 [Candidatus Omnitrophica bacterium]|nr:hypothetical protein [Candidatus Omnitrophota bacterium]